ncbi:MAG: VCBS repeat-containing protein [Gammaproteobacteria bacterium]|nr:VCBS repeat-containing protein [Gammaproteobacteria bacterium]
MLIKFFVTLTASLILLQVQGCGLLDGAAGDSGFKISGTLSGLEDGKELSLSLNDSKQLTLSQNGGFSFDSSLAEAASYSVAITSQPGAQSCIMNNASGSIVGSSIDNIQIVCFKEGEYSVSAKVMGLDTAMTLTLTAKVPESSNTADTITEEFVLDATGTYTFLTPVPTGNGYEVAIKTLSSEQLCKTNDGLGIVGSEHVLITILCGTQDDEDGDGLTNDEELNTYFTSPKIADTDGDGLSDYEEIVTRGFNTAQNFKFNPRIADLPKLKIGITSEPSVSLNITKSGSTETQNLKNKTTGDVTTQEDSYSIGVEVGMKQELGTKGAKWTGHWKANFNWTRTDTTETYNTVETTTGTVSLNGWEKNGGSVKTTVKLSNNGNRTFTITHLLLNATMTGTNGQLVPVGSLTLDGIGAFPEDSLEPLGETGELVFSNNDLFPNIAEDLLLRAKSLSVNIAGYDVADKDGVSMAFLQEQAAAQGAQIIIDYANRKVPVDFVVATNFNPLSTGVTLTKILSDILQLSYETSAGGGLTALEGINNVDKANAKWVIIHEAYDGVSTQSFLYDQSNEVYQLSDIMVRAGDKIALIYLEDDDGDGLGLRQELALGTDPTLADTDGDGRTDYQEVYEQWVVTSINSLYPNLYPSEVYSDPTVADIDGDGDNDSTEMAKGNDPYNKDTDGDSTPDNMDTDIIASSFSITSPVSELQSSNSINLKGVVVPNSGEGICSIDVDWGDGTAVSTKAILCATIKTAQSYDFTHNYSVSGSYVVVITATDTTNAVITKAYTAKIGAKNEIAKYMFNDNWREALDFREVVDIDNDGKADIVAIDDLSGVWVSKGSETGFGAPVKWGVDLQWTLTSSYDNTTIPRHLVDVDSDGDLDLVGFFPKLIYVSINDGTQFRGAINWYDGFGRDTGWDVNSHVRTFGDVDGNGYVDVIGFGGSAVYVLLNSGTKDANGDMVKISDASQLKTMAFVDNPATTALNETNTFTSSASWNSYRHTRWVTDVNRDGKADILGLAETELWVSLGQGDGTFASPTPYLTTDVTNMTAGKGGWTDNRTYPRILSDVDGDGDQDIVGFGNSGVAVIENTSVVSGVVSFASVRTIVNGSFGYQDTWRDTFDDGTWMNHHKHIRTLADMNGDGLNDVVGFGSQSVWVSLNKGSFQFGPALDWQNTEFDLGGSTACTYEWYHNDHTYKQRYYFTRRAADVNGDGSADLVGFGRCNTKTIFSSTLIANP